MSIGVTERANGRQVPTDALRITFHAALPPIQSAIQVSGDGNGGRLKLDVPASDVEAMVLLQLYGTRKLLRVTVEIVTEA